MGGKIIVYSDDIFDQGNTNGIILRETSYRYNILTFN